MAVARRKKVYRSLVHHVCSNKPSHEDEAKESMVACFVGLSITMLIAPVITLPT